jgi:hypothetical protein
MAAWEHESHRRARAARAAGRRYDWQDSGTTRSGGPLLRCTSCGALVWRRDLADHAATFHRRAEVGAFRPVAVAAG